MNRRKIIDNPDAEKIFHLYYDLIERLFNKAKKGELDYQSDMRKLDQYLARAERAGIGDEMHGLILNHKGLICSMSGRTKEGNAFYQQGHDWFRQLDDIHGVMMVTTNYA
ncbi:MAG: hypothetical protein H6670_18085, partial [Anaerolineaceae bacterium]|nr:hypothetical protein [Anaerolineaceae bacterium]